jgi:hypothetical protein
MRVVGERWCFESSVYRRSLLARRFAARHMLDATKGRNSEG